jgi:hypothetical protein
LHLEGRWTTVYVSLSIRRSNRSCRKLYRENFMIYSPQQVLFQRLEQGGHVVRMWKREEYRGFCCGKLKVEGSLKDVVVGLRIILN